MIYELVLRNFDCSLEFVFSLLLLQPFNFSPVSFACNFQDWGCVILGEIDFLLKICWSIPCLHPSWKAHTWIALWLYQLASYGRICPLAHALWDFRETPGQAGWLDFSGWTMANFLITVKNHFLFIAVRSQLIFWRRCFYYIFCFY